MSVKKVLRRVLACGLVFAALAASCAMGEDVSRLPPQTEEQAEVQGMEAVDPEADLPAEVERGEQPEEAGAEEIEPEEPLPEENPEPENGLMQEPEEEIVATETEETEAAPPSEPMVEEPVEADVWDILHQQGWAYGTVLGQAEIRDEQGNVLFIVEDDGYVVLLTGSDDAADLAKVWFLTWDNQVQTGYVSKEAIGMNVDQQSMSAEWPSTTANTEAGELPVFFVAVMIEDMLAESAWPEADTEPESAPQELEAETIQPGDYVRVFPGTAVYLEPEREEMYDGVFVSEACVEVESAAEDAEGRIWYQVRYRYGNAQPDGRMIWTDENRVFVPADEVQKAEEAADLDVTDYALDYPLAMMFSYIDEYSLRDSYGNVGYFYPGQTDMYASSGHDREYKQIAKLPGHGTIYATPHYLDGNTVYCLEHTMNSPGVRDYDSGPYEIVDLEGYQQKPGYSGFIFSDQTMHAIGWVMRHTYPFMVLDRHDADNDVWSRVAGQFAIREVVKQLEGAQYVREYWEMDDFYRAKDQAPGDYLEYARWLAREGVARGSITGKIEASGKSSSFENGQMKGSVTLTTDADLIRIPTYVGTLTGNSAGSDGEYYYLYSGDSITVTASGSSLSFTAESVSSPDEEANFLVGIPDADIQKILIPQDGAPQPFQKMTITFDVPQGAVEVTKTSLKTGKGLPGTTFELIASDGSVLKTQTTGEGGTTVFQGLQPGVYTVRETAVPEGYTIGMPNEKSVTVQSGQMAGVDFANAVSQSKIRIEKKDAVTKMPIAGVQFTIERLTAPESMQGDGIGAQVILTTNAEGIAQTDWLEWGTYRITETGVPAGYVNSHYSADVEAKEEGKTFTIEVENDPAMGQISVEKVDTEAPEVRLEGAVFSVFDQRNGELVDTITTDSEGSAVTKALPLGSYDVVEQAAPYGYVVDSTRHQVELVWQNEDTPIVVETVSLGNRKVRGKIKILKRDANTQNPLAGAEFTVTRSASLPAQSGEAFSVVLVTDAQGNAETDWLDWGSYRIEETKVPEGYVNAHFVTDVEVNDDGKTYSVEVENTAVTGRMKIIKQGIQHAERRLPGAVFEVRAAEAIVGSDGSVFYQKDEKVDTITTDEHGEAITRNLPLGKYKLSETEAPEGYICNGQPIEMTLSAEDENTPVVEAETVVRNQEIFGKIRIAKKDAASKKPLAGAEFTVTRLSVPESANGAGIGEVAAVLTTDETGSAETDWLEWGSYEVRETKVPEGYRDTAFSQVVAVKEDGAVCEVEAENEAVQGKIVIKKTGTAHADWMLSGAEFDVLAAEQIVDYDGSVFYQQDELVDTVLTDDRGQAVTKLLPLGQYYAVERKAPEGFVISKERTDVQLRYEGAQTPVVTAETVIPNAESRSKIRIEKCDSGTGKPLAGVEFTITRLSAPHSAQDAGVGEVAAVLKTDENGCAQTDWLEWGRYRIEETKPPMGYVALTDVLEVDAAEDGKTYEFSIPNEPVMGTISVDKKGLQLTEMEKRTHETGFEFWQPVYQEAYLAGAVFEIRAAEPIIGPDGTLFFEQDQLADTIVTTGQGQDSSPKLPLGRYVVQEISAPSGYVLDQTKHEAVLNFADAKTPIIKMTIPVGNDYMTSEISMRKEKEILKTVNGGGQLVQQASEYVPGAGFVFSICNAEPFQTKNGEVKANTVMGIGVTDEQGKLTFSGRFPHERYTIRELQAPEGWKINPHDFAVKLDPQKAVNHVIYAELEEAVQDEIVCAHVRLMKKEITGQETIPGALIEVRSEKGEVIYRSYTDDQGCIPDIPVVPGSYTFREILAPSGYELNTAEMTFTVHADGSVTGDTEIRDDYTRVQLVKQDEKGRPLEGVEFGLFKHTGVQLMSALSDEQGMVTFEKIPYGKYKIRETKPLPYYYPSEVEVELTVDGSFINPGKPIQTITNERRKLHCIKVDTSGKYLAGVEFTLLNAETEEIVETVTSNEHGEFVFTKIALGDWIIRESQAPVGYSRMEDIRLHVDESWREPEPIRCVNIPNHYEFLKIDEHGNPIQGAKFRIEDERSILYEMVSDKDGIVHADDLEPGVYVIREIEAAEGFECTDETIHLVIDDRYVVADEMRRLVNYPADEEDEEDKAIQTGVEMPWTPMMTAGVLLIVLAAALMTAVIKKK